MEGSVITIFVCFSVFMCFLPFAVAAQSRITPELIFVQGGTFTMGSPALEHNRYDNEGPEHQVRVSGFYIGKYEVTQKEYQDAMGTNSSEHKGEELPLENITWYEAVAYCNARSLKEGLNPAYAIDGENVSWNRGANGYRLPTEAEWEYAAKGGNNHSAFLYAGNNNADSAGWHSGNSGGKSRPVGTKAANALGLFDMSGNVGEMCWDYHGAYSSAAQTDPQGAVAGTYRVGRGGCWFYGAQYLRAGFRAYITPAMRYSFVGFRLARNAE
jgi:formylglycine-generating enzyme required for sulfatase activity